MKFIKKFYEINAPIDKVWDGLINPDSINKWGGGPSRMNDEEGFEFKLWGGDVFGKNIKVIKEKLLTQEWFGGDWDKPSIVTFNLKTANGKTVVELIHTDVPDKEVKDIEQGWGDYYMLPLKKLVEQT
ncbi:MAG: SRPBCC domain-containing protein [Candidatus Levybacteria bacterium]|nr:SRPBCC domain-containing protein [Candidatus Levybacteria bacterium]